ncbi:hypothetical protein LCGC14_2435070 [marine sediment metagenome]|uniref:Uncharacterized protein n=1 Tax=marine sediment metagenome TaxID=412755 RepID=A0A0F9DXR5_9ZZZZ
MTPKPKDKPAGKLWIIPMCMSCMLSLFAGMAIAWWGSVILAVVAAVLFGIAVWLESEGV